MENKKETKKEKIMQVIDVFFVMILCFVVLLVTMLFQNLAGVKEAGKAYVIQGIWRRWNFGERLERIWFGWIWSRWWGGRS